MGYPFMTVQALPRAPTESRHSLPLLMAPRIRALQRLMQYEGSARLNLHADVADEITEYARTATCHPLAPGGQPFSYLQIDAEGRLAGRPVGQATIAAPRGCERVRALLGDALLLEFMHGQVGRRPKFTVNLRWRLQPRETAAGPTAPEDDDDAYFRVDPEGLGCCDLYLCLTGLAQPGEGPQVVRRTHEEFSAIRLQTRPRIPVARIGNRFDEGLILGPALAPGSGLVLRPTAYHAPGQAVSGDRLTLHIRAW